MDENKQAIILLSAQFSAPGKGALTPLTALEYGRFAAWMRQTDFQPKDLFHQFDTMMERWLDPKGKVTVERLQYLLGRGMAMGVAVQKWQSAGIWILTRADREYPSRLKRHLSEAAPAVLFGVGEKGLLNAGGLAMVGSRKIESKETEFTKTVAKQAALEGLNLVSGGARGVDETAMLAALEIDGTALGILANDLFKSALLGKWRKYLKSGQVTLVSPFYPEARFHVGSAMGRNKYIYCLSDYALVVRSEKDTGGTWAGATENLKEKNRWVPIFVASPSDAAGNVALVEMGAGPLHIPESESMASDDWLLSQLRGHEAPVVSRESATEQPDAQENVISEPSTVEQEVTTEDADAVEIDAADRQANASEVSHTLETEPEAEPGQAYEEFMQYVSQQILDKGEVKFSELKETRQDLTQKQIREWLDQAVESGVLKRKGRSLAYTQILPDLFSE
ncbi:MAG: DNA-processing protein DprA [Halieaceae bacterium]|nr:DNA-processing protein DprA [Halieaceae bacterium]